MKQSNWNNENWQNNVERSERTMPAVLQVLERLTGEPCRAASFEADTKECTDVDLIRTNRRVAVRIRSTAYLSCCQNEITFRSKVIKNLTTEWDKLQAGIVPHLLLYGFATPEPDDQLICYSLVDLRVLVPLLLQRPEYISEHANRDGTAFKAIDLRGYPESVVVPISIKGAQ